MNSEDRSVSIKERAFQLGFSAVGVTDLRRNSHKEHLLTWLSSGMAGTMTYMHRQANRRLEPAKILCGATRAVVLLRNYFNTEPSKKTGSGRIAKYARGPDYHDVLREPLQKLVNHMVALGNSNTVARSYVDAGPVPERELAQRAGLGWIGKNSMLINPRFGSYVFVATVLTNLEIALDQPFSADHCGTCNRCVESCPTGAIQNNRMVDSRSCISYLTIEYRGEIQAELRNGIGDWLFGCDVCQNVCPWNLKFGVPANDVLLELDPDKGQANLTNIIEMSTETFTERFEKTTMMRTGLECLRRNARIASQNLKNEQAEDSNKVNA